jgi:hypothetical protein
MYKEKYLKYKTKYLELKNQLGGYPTASQLKLQAQQKIQIAEKRQQSSQVASQTLLAAQAKVAQTQAEAEAAQLKLTQIQSEQKEANKTILIAEGELSNINLSIGKTENRLLKAQEKKEKMLQIADDALKQLIKVAQEQKDEKKLLLSPDITLEQLITSLLGKEYKDKRSVLLSLEAIKQEVKVETTPEAKVETTPEAKVKTTPEAQKQPTTLQEALVKLYRVLKELLLYIEIEEDEEEILRFLKYVIEPKQYKLVELIKKKAQVIKEKVIVQKLENGDLLLDDYLIGRNNTEQLNDTEQLTNIIINPTEQFYTKNNFTDMLPNINVFIVLNKLFIEDDRYAIKNINYELQNIKLPVGILINFIENQIYVIIQETQYSYNVMKSDSYSVKELSEFDKYYIYNKVSYLYLYYRLIDNLINCLKESKNVIKLLNNNNLLSMIETQLRTLSSILHEFH